MPITARCRTNLNIDMCYLIPKKIAHLLVFSNETCPMFNAAKINWHFILKVDAVKRLHLPHSSAPHLPPPAIPFSSRILRKSRRRRSSTSYENYEVTFLLIMFVHQFMLNIDKRTEKRNFFVVLFSLYAIGYIFRRFM